MTSTNDSGDTAKRIEGFLQTLLTASGLDLRFQFLACNGQAQTTAASPAVSVEFRGPILPCSPPATPNSCTPSSISPPRFSASNPINTTASPSTPTTSKFLRNAELELIAQTGAERVRATGRPFAFPPMNSRERRLLHLALSASGLPTASTSDGPRRFVVLYPEGHEPAPQPDQTSDRTRAIRNTFRRR